MDHKLWYFCKNVICVNPRHVMLFSKRINNCEIFFQKNAKFLNKPFVE